MKSKLMSIIVVIAVVAVVAVAAVMVMNSKVNNDSSSDDIYLEFDDSLGTHFVLNEPLKKVVILNRQTSMAFSILQAEDVVVATGDTTIKNEPYLTKYQSLPDVGETGSPDIEKIIELMPDAVFCYTNRAMDLEEKLNPVGIKVIRIDNYQPEKYDQEMLLLGKILNKTQRAQEFVDYENALLNTVSDVVGKMSDADKPTVMALSIGFINGSGGYRIFPCYSTDGTAGVGEGCSSILAGGKDASPSIMYDKTQASTTVMVDQEFVLDKCKPEVIVLHGTWLGGYECTDSNDWKTVLDNIHKVSTIDQTPAGANKKVYAFHTDMLGAALRPIGILQLAKYLHPDEFSDMDPEKIAEEFFDKWLGSEFKGIWWYAEA